METLRIPVRYKKAINRLSKEKRLWLYDSLLDLCDCVDVTVPDDPEGDLLELVWRDAIQMENRNVKKDDMNIGVLASSLSPGSPGTGHPGHPEPEVNRSEVKGSEVKLPTDTHELNIWIKENLPNVSKMKTQLTNEDAIELLQEYNSNDVSDILQAMENTNALVKKYKSVDLTARGWLKHRGAKIKTK